MRTIIQSMLPILLWTVFAVTWVAPVQAKWTSERIITDGRSATITANGEQILYTSKNNKLMIYNVPTMTSRQVAIDQTYPGSCRISADGNYALVRSGKYLYRLENNADAFQATQVTHFDGYETLYSDISARGIVVFIDNHATLYLYDPQWGPDVPPKKIPGNEPDHYIRSSQISQNGKHITFIRIRNDEKGSYAYDFKPEFVNGAVAYSDDTVQGKLGLAANPTTNKLYWISRRSDNGQVAYESWYFHPTIEYRESKIYASGKSLPRLKFSTCGHVDPAGKAVWYFTGLWDLFPLYRYDIATGTRMEMPYKIRPTAGYPYNIYPLLSFNAAGTLVVYQQRNDIYLLSETLPVSSATAEVSPVCAQIHAPTQYTHKIKLGFGAKDTGVNKIDINVPPTFTDVAVAGIFADDSSAPIGTCAFDAQNNRLSCTTDAVINENTGYHHLSVRFSATITSPGDYALTSRAGMDADVADSVPALPGDADNSTQTLVNTTNITVLQDAVCEFAAAEITPSVAPMGTQTRFTYTVKPNVLAWHKGVNQLFLSYPQGYTNVRLESIQVGNTLLVKGKDYTAASYPDQFGFKATLAKVIRNKPVALGFTATPPDKVNDPAFYACLNHTDLDTDAEVETIAGDVNGDGQATIEVALKRSGPCAWKSSAIAPTVVSVNQTGVAFSHTTSVTIGPRHTGVDTLYLSLPPQIISIDEQRVRVLVGLEAVAHSCEITDNTLAIQLEEKLTPDDAEKEVAIQVMFTADAPAEQGALPFRGTIADSRFPEDAITMPAVNVAVQKPAQKVTVVFNAVSGGWFEGGPNIITKTVPKDGTLTSPLAVPAPGYVFDRWICPVMQSKQNPMVVDHLIEDLYITARFRPTKDTPGPKPPKPLHTGHTDRK